MGSRFGRLGRFGRLVCLGSRFGRLGRFGRLSRFGRLGRFGRLVCLGSRLGRLFGNRCAPFHFVAAFQCTTLRAVGVGIKQLFRHKFWCIARFVSADFGFGVEALVGFAFVAKAAGGTQTFAPRFGFGGSRAPHWLAILDAHRLTKQLGTSHVRRTRQVFDFLVDRRAQPPLVQLDVYRERVRRRAADVQLARRRHRRVIRLVAGAIHLAVPRFLTARHLGHTLCPQLLLSTCASTHRAFLPDAFVVLECVHIPRGALAVHFRFAAGPETLGAAVSRLEARRARLAVGRPEYIIAHGHPVGHELGSVGQMCCLAILSIFFERLLIFDLFGSTVAAHVNRNHTSAS